MPLSIHNTYLNACIHTYIHMISGLKSKAKNDEDVYFPTLSNVTNPSYSEIKLAGQLTQIHESSKIFH